MSRPKVWSIYIDENEENQYMLSKREALKLAKKWARENEAMEVYGQIVVVNVATEEEIKVT